MTILSDNTDLILATMFNYYKLLAYRYDYNYMMFIVMFIVTVVDIIASHCQLRHLMDRFMSCPMNWVSVAYSVTCSVMHAWYGQNRLLLKSTTTIIEKVGLVKILDNRLWYYDYWAHKLSVIFRSKEIKKEYGNNDLWF